jgi:hypothetical protein
MSSIRRTLFLPVLACGSLISACGDSPSDEAVAPTSTANKQPKVAGLPPQMVAAVPAGQSSTVVSVHFALGKLPLVGQALPVDVAIVPHQEFTSVRAQFAGVDGLPVTVGTAMEPVANVKAEAILEHQLVLLPGSEGVFMISATVETESPDGTITRVFSLPMIVAREPNPAPAPAAAPPATPTPQ